MKHATIFFPALAMLILTLACSSGDDKTEPLTPGSNDTHKAQDGTAKETEKQGKDGYSPGMTAYRLRMEGKYQEARDTLDYEDLCDEKDLCGLFELARTDFFLNDLDGAYKAIKRVLRLDGENPRYLFWHGFIAFRLNQMRYHINDSLNLQLTEESMKSLRKAIEIDPMCHPARFQLIYLLVRLRPDDGGDRDEAARVAEKMVKLDEGWGTFALGKTIVPGRPWDDIVERAGKIIEKDPDNMGALLAKTEGLMLGGDPLEAEKLIERIIALDADWRHLYLALAQTAFRTQVWDRSYVWVDKFLAFPDLVFPERAHARLVIARLQKRHNGKEAWAKYLEKACELDPKILSRYQMPLSDLNKPPIKENSP